MREEDALRAHVDLVYVGFADDENFLHGLEIQTHYYLRGLVERKSHEYYQVDLQ